jgi:hypothetical protein
MILNIKKFIIGFQQVTRVYGTDDKVPEFDFNVKDLKSIDIYYSAHVNAMEFYLINGSSFIFGSKTISNYFGWKSVLMHKKIDLLNKTITAIELRSGCNIDSISFLLKDINTNALSMTPTVGGLQGQNFYTLNASSLIGLEEIVGFIGTTTNKNSIRSIQFKYISLVNHGNLITIYIFLISVYFLHFF